MTVAELKTAADRAVAEMAEASQGEDEPVLITYRDDDEYQAANRYIMKFLPGVPYAHSSPALGFQNNVQGYKPSPVSLEPFSPVFYGGGK